MTMKKKTLGRQKIEIKKLEKKSNRQVTFSKRRAGLFKKPGEISLLCGVEVAILVFSRSGKIFGFGNPNIETVLDRFLNGCFSPPTLVESYFPVAEFNRNFADATMKLEMEKKRSVEVMESGKMNNGELWWEESMENMGIEDLKQYRLALLDLRAKVAERVEEMAVLRVGGPLLPVLPHVAGNHPVTIDINGFGLRFFS